MKDASLGLLASGQLVTQGGKRTASGRLIIGRVRAVVNPQTFAWEQLKAPVLVEDFAELSARLRLLPPASFRPRRAAGDFHVCPLAAIDHATFDPATNSVIAIVRDRNGQQAFISHPWSDRGRTGAEALLAELTAPSAKPLFVAGHVRAAGAALRIHPTALVFASDDQSRRVVMPWIGAETAATARLANSPHAGTGADISRYTAASELAAELVLNGHRRLSGRQWPQGQRTATETEERGYHQMAGILRALMAAGDVNPAAFALLKLLALARDADLDAA